MVVIVCCVMKIRKYTNILPFITTTHTIYTKIYYHIALSKAGHDIAQYNHHLGYFLYI
jgi:hypothetical protein